MKSNKKTPSHRKILIFFADNIGLTIIIDLVRFEQILCFSKIEGSITPEVNRMGVSKVIGWSVNYTWNLSKKIP